MRPPGTSWNKRKETKSGDPRRGGGSRKPRQGKVGPSGSPREVLGTEGVCVSVLKTRTELRTDLVVNLWREFSQPSHRPLSLV